MGIASSFLLLILMPHMVRNNVTISDVLTKETSFYYRRFQTFPSQLATVEYSVIFNLTRISYLCDGNGCNVILDIYTTEQDINLKTNCSNDSFGQLRNENLRTSLKLRYRPYRFTTCKLDDVDSDILYCKGRTVIQDYKPRHYGFSFGYDCDISTKPSLVGLSYNFTISGQSNKTQCFQIPQRLSKPMKECSDFYNHTSLPNMIGDPDIASVNSWGSQVSIYISVGSYFLSQLPKGGCYKYTKEVFCQIVFPQCNHHENQIIYPCKETLSDLRSGCLEHVKAGLEVFSSSNPRFFEKWRTAVQRNEVYSDYLPSFDDPVPCYYKPVTCDPPPNVTNAKITSGIVLNGTYLAMSQVEYECLNETFQMEWNSTVTCMYSGQWYKTPKCLKRTNLNPLCIVIPLLIAPICIFIVTHIARGYVCRRKKSLLLKRNREYDAFVCYNFDEDHHFVFNSILPELEENHDPPLKMFIHDRDFIPGQEISINIHNAVTNCNSTIIVMSQGFIDSPRYREEFTKCVAESVQDPAFKLFIIMMEEVNSLVNVPENMHSFFKEKTYIKTDDPKVFEKIGNHLVLMRHHYVKDDNVELEHLVANQDEI